MMVADSVGRARSLYDFAVPVDPGHVKARDPLLSDLVGTRAFQRLKSVRFLGGIDYLFLRSLHDKTGNTRYTRYQHSLGVARLALYYSDLRGLASPERRLVLAAALLHDIGHGPLSHSLEPVFKKVFDLEHHRATEDIITGRAPLSREVYDTLCRHQVNIERVLAIIAGEEPTHDGFFSGPINFDTIEGILRARSYSEETQSSLKPETVVKAAFERLNDDDRNVVDSFWLQKDSVYRHQIHSKEGVLADFACALLMERHIDMIEAEDYFTTEDHIFRKLPGLRQLLTSPSFATEILEQVDEPIAYRARRFFIEPTVDFFTRDDKGRYRQTSEVRILSPRSVGAREDLTREHFDDDQGDRSGQGVL
jgi:hypothetical protein